MENSELKKLIKESVREVLKEERLKIYEVLIPYVSKSEQREIEKQIGYPSDYSEEDFEDKTDWLYK
jgi:hypothetical protein